MKNLLNTQFLSSLLLLILQGNVFVRRKSKNSIFIARVLSWLGSAVSFLDSRIAYQVYKSSEQLYNSFRQANFKDGTHCTYTENEIKSLSSFAGAA